MLFVIVEEGIVSESFNVTVLVCVPLFAVGSGILVLILDCFVRPFSVGRAFVDLQAKYTLRRCKERMSQIQPGGRVEWGALLFVQNSVIRPEMEIKCRDHNLAVIEIMLTYYAGDLESLNLVEALGELLSERRSVLLSLSEIVRSRGAIFGRMRSKGRSAPDWVKSEFSKREEELRITLGENSHEIAVITAKLQERISQSRSQEVIQ